MPELKRLTLNFTLNDEGQIKFSSEFFQGGADSPQYFNQPLSSAGVIDGLVTSLDRFPEVLGYIYTASSIMLSEK
jgi:hypothetical protein